MESLFLYLQLRVMVAEDVGHRCAENGKVWDLYLRVWQVVVQFVFRPVCA